MPPKKGVRRSMPARINQVNNTTLTPSRRSPRVPANGKTSSESTTSSTKASPTPPESLNFRFYQPKTPHKSPLPHSRSRNASPDVPLNRRRTFQARPSRLSTVFAPVVETPKSSQSSRRTRRTAALETPKHDPSDLDFPELLGTTGWTFDQYLGKFNSDDMGAEKPTTSSSSTEARSSTRLRKPTARAVEASESKQKPRKAKTPAPAPSKPSTTAASGPKGIVKTKQNSKAKAVKKVVRRRIDRTQKEAGRKLYDLAAAAMGVDFSVPADLEKIIAETREAFEQRQGGAANALNGDKTETAREPVQDGPRPPCIIKFKKMAPPRLDSDGWTNAGRVNDKGEEIVLTPTDASPYRSPHSYGDEELPYPPVRARSDSQAESDNALGFPPLIGDRNIPVNTQSPFKTENVTEEKALAQARGQKRRQEAPVYEVPAKKSRRNRRQPEDAVVDSAIASPSVGTPAAAETEDIKPPFQRLKLKLKPKPLAAAEHPPTNEPASQRQSGSVQGSVRGSGRGTGRGNARGRGRGGGRGAARGVERGGSSSSTRGSSRGTTRGGERGARGGTRGAGAGRGGSSSSSRGASSQGSTSTRGRAGTRGVTKNRGRGRGRGTSAK